MMNSCLYRAHVVHHRLSPRRHQFHYQVFLFYLDLDEIGMLSDHLRWVSHNRFNLFNFRDKDHLQFPRQAPDLTKGVRQQITDYLQSQQVYIGKGKIFLLTNLCTLGYQFNPVSFYFCYDEQGQPVCAIAEVGNTFREMKPYLLGTDFYTGYSFCRKVEKYFYVSPFTDMNTFFDFDLAIPDERLRIRIDDYNQKGERFFISTLAGERVALTDANLLRCFFRFPLITLQVIGAIHWQALKLWIKKIPYHKKEAHKDLQREVYRPYKPN